MYYYCWSISTNTDYFSGIVIEVVAPNSRSHISKRRRCVCFIRAARKHPAKEWRLRVLYLYIYKLRGPLNPPRARAISLDPDACIPRPIVPRADTRRDTRDSFANFAMQIRAESDTPIRYGGTLTQPVASSTVAHYGCTADAGEMHARRYWEIYVRVERRLSVSIRRWWIL